MKILFCVGLALASTLACASPADVSLCSEDQPNFPWIVPGRPAYISVMMDMVAQRLALHIRWNTKPWKRCLAEMQINAVDGVVNASFIDERTQMGVFPMIDGRPDTSRRLLISSYSLYKVRGTDVDWNGEQFINLKGVVGAQTSFSIVERLRSMRITVDDSSKSSRDLLRALILGVFPAVALQTTDADREIAASVEFRTQIEKVKTPLWEKPYYLMLSKRFVAEHPTLAEDIWKSIAIVRESPEFAARVAPLMNGP